MAAPPTIRKGNTGAAVTLLQKKLGLPLATFGNFDSYTEERVKAFQKSRGLTQDGIVGPKTWTALGVTSYTEPTTTTTRPGSGGILWDTLYGGGGATGGAGGGSQKPAAAAIAEGSTVRFTANVLNALGGRALFVSQSVLDRLSAALMRRGYANANADSTYSEATIEATLTQGKTSTTAMAQDLISAGNDADCPVGNVRVEITGTPGSGGVPPGTPPKKKNNNDVLVIGAVAVIALALFMPRN